MNTPLAAFVQNTFRSLGEIEALLLMEWGIFSWLVTFCHEQPCSLGFQLEQALQKWRLKRMGYV